MPEIQTNVILKCFFSRKPLGRFLIRGNRKAWVRKREDFESNLKVSTEATVESLVSTAAQVIGKLELHFQSKRRLKVKTIYTIFEFPNKKIRLAV